MSNGEKMELAARKNGGLAADVDNPAYETETLSPDAIRLTQYDLNHLTVHQAAREGDVAIIERLMEKYQTNQQRKKRINSKDDSKLTPLHYAARYTHYHMLQYLLKNGANPNAKAEDGATALHFLAKYKKKRITVEGGNDDDDSSESEEDELPPEETFSCLKLLVDNGAQINAKDSMGLTPLHHACTRGNTKAVRELIECAGIGMEMADNQGMTSLHLACLYNKRSIVRILIDAGANMRARDKDATTPLLLACAEGGKKIAELLLEKASERSRANEENNRPKDSTYASIEPAGIGDLLRDTDGEKNLPLHLAIENGHLDLVEFCIEKSIGAGLGPMVEIRRSREETCLHLAVLSNNIDIVQLLMRHGADVNAKNSSMASPLFVAAQYNAHTIVKYLLEHGANVDMKDNDFFTPLLVASKHGHLETITHLLDHHADITETDKDDKTCIIWAAEEDRTDALSILLQSPKGRALIEERDRYNNTALHMASSKGHVNAVKFLLQYKAPADIKNDDDRTTLHMAALNGNDLIIPELIARDRTILNAGDEDANAALHLAAMGGNLKCVEILIQLGANIEMRNAKQWTPLDSAAAYGWEKPARALLEAGAAVQPRGKIRKNAVSPLHLSAKNGHLEMVNLLLNWRADVTFRSADGRNALDFAIDSNQKDCVVALLKHSTWKDSLRNSVVNPVNGRMSTPMRKLIKKMPDLAEIVYNQCITDNGKKPEDDNYTITLLYEFLDDMYASSAWNDYALIEPNRKESYDTAGDDAMYANPTVIVKPSLKDKDVYDDNGHLTNEARTYSQDSDELQKNHPLKIMVSAKREELLLHPVVTGLLNYKWRSFGRYVYYTNLTLFIIYLLILNIYMMTLPRPYQIDWILVIYSRQYIYNNDSTAAAALINRGLVPDEQTLSCYYYRIELTSLEESAYAAGCQTVPATYDGIKWTIFAFSAFNLLREFFQLFNQRLRYVSEFTNFVEISLYVLSLILTLNYPGYYVDPVTLPDENKTENLDLVNNSSDVLINLQDDTGLRQEWQSEIGAFAIFLAWMGLLLFIQKIPYLGIFVVMFTDILKTFAQFFFVFVFFIFGFAFAFNILLGNQYVFATWYDSIIKTTVMMIGELDYGDIFFSYKDEGSTYFQNIYTNSVSYVLFSIFLIVMTIIIMNLLVGLAVGDIIEVQEHATLERLGMTVDLALDVEFTLPEFLRKRVCLRKQTIEVNKYRKANAIKKFFLEDSALTVENITKSLNREKGEQDEMRDSLDRVLTGLGRLRNRLTDVIGEQSEVKMGIFGIRSQMREARMENKTSSREIKDSVALTRELLTGQLGQTHDGLTEVARRESLTTRTRVDDAQTLIKHLQDELSETRQTMTQVKLDLEERMERMQKELMERKGRDLEEGLEECNNKIEKTRAEVLQSLEEMKMILVKEKYMTSV
uniref:transient receptor potential cation channel subfamily A member 1 homolog isoform X2 n=1 Tax=Styela clava TaxID=7725 RepID=UPI00193ACC5B|nr:transient receptor potential cation channel subfamily A member 1 homolog isoform X2 [Styela clava]